MNDSEKKVVLQILAAARKRPLEGEFQGKPVFGPEKVDSLAAMLCIIHDGVAYASRAASNDLTRHLRLKPTAKQRSFAKAVDRLRESWHALSPAEKWNFVWASEPLVGNLNRWTDRPAKHTDRNLERIERAIEQVSSLTTRDVPLPRGHKRGVTRAGKSRLPLLAFVHLLKRWWEFETAERFGQEFSEPVEADEEPQPISPAANFVCEAAKLLTVAYSNAEIKAAMIEVQSGSH